MSRRDWMRFAVILAALGLLVVNIAVGILPIASAPFAGRAPGSSSYPLVATTAFAAVMLYFVLIRPPAVAIQQVTIVGPVVRLICEGGRIIEVKLGGRDSHLAVRAYWDWPSRGVRRGPSFLLDGP